MSFQGHYYGRGCSINPSIFSEKMLTGRFRFVNKFYKRAEDEVLLSLVVQIMAT